MNTCWELDVLVQDFKQNRVKPRYQNFKGPPSTHVLEHAVFPFTSYTWVVCYTCVSISCWESDVLVQDFTQNCIKPRYQNFKGPLSTHVLEHAIFPFTSYTWGVCYTCVSISCWENDVLLQDFTQNCKTQVPEHQAPTKHLCSCTYLLSCNVLYLCSMLHL